MKRVGMGLLLVVSCEWTQAQFRGRNLSQGTTELKNNAAQIIALQTLDATSQEGYDELEDGLTNIGNIHGAEYLLHQDYFASLKAVNPVIAGMPEVKEIRSIAPILSPTLTAAIGNWTNSGKLKAGELAAMAALDTNLGQLASTELAVLQTLLTAGQLTMSDADRVQAIRTIDRAVHAQYEFLEQVCAEGDLLVANRKKL